MRNELQRVTAVLKSAQELLQRVDAGTLETNQKLALMDSELKENMARITEANGEDDS